MTSSDDSQVADDPHHLSRFVLAQQGNYEQAISEITSGRKRSHWMWYASTQLRKAASRHPQAAESRPDS
jgi:uncharacterized protein (DUF1810 family)